MAISTTEIIVNRASSAKERSGIAVFVVIVDGIKKLDAFFANTVEVCRRIKGMDTGYAGKYIGTYSGTSGALNIASELKKAML